MQLGDIPLKTIDGNDATFSDYQGGAVLVVNVASKCGFTPQYAGLQELYERYSERGLTVLGFPCNQFKGQEPGTAEDIQQFCSMNYGVSFPLFDKIDVNGEHRHPLFEKLVQAPDDSGNAGDVLWNFEKFLVSSSGNVRRFRGITKPTSKKVIRAIEDALASSVG